MNPLAPVTIASPFIFGMILALLGSIKLPLAKRLNIDEARVGGMLAVLNLALIPMMLLSGILTDNLGVQGVLIGGGLVTSLAMFGLAMSNTYQGALWSILFVGMGGAGLSVAGSVLMPAAFFKDTVSPTAATNLGNIFFGLGALVTPALADVFISRFDLRRTLSLIAALCLAVCLTAVVTPHDAFDAFSGGSVETAKEGGILSDVLTNRFLWICALVFLLYGPLEGALGTWATTYLTELGYGERRAAWLLSGFWLSFLASRMLMAYLTHQNIIKQQGEAWAIVVLALLSAVALGNLTGTHNRANGSIGLLLLGACFGPIFPTLVGILFSHFEVQERGTAFGAMFTIGATGSLIIPPLMGAYAKRTHSVRVALRIPTLVALLLVGASLVLAL